MSLEQCKKLISKQIEWLPVDGEKGEDQTLFQNALYFAEKLKEVPVLQYLGGDVVEMEFSEGTIQVNLKTMQRTYTGKLISIFAVQEAYWKQKQQEIAEQWTSAYQPEITEPYIYLAS